MARFAFLVIGDTQYLFDGERERPDLLERTFSQAREIARSCQTGPVAHVIHVGDVTEHGWAQECESAATVLAQGCRSLGAGMSVVAGNHDIDQTTDDSRGTTPFLRAFGPHGDLVQALSEAGLSQTPVVTGPGGYSTWKVLPVGGDEALRVAVLTLDWRPTQQTYRWAQELLAAHPQLPTVLVTHDVALHHRDSDGVPTGPGELTEHGERLIQVLAGHEQVFLVLGGHEWPSTRLRYQGREIHAVNYQELPYGGGGAARLYCFDTDRGQCEVVSFSPGASDGTVMASVAARRALALARPQDQFRFPLPASLGGQKRPWQADGLELLMEESDPQVLASSELTLELGGRHVMELEISLPRTMPDSWQVIMCRLTSGLSAPDGSPEPLAALSLSTENFLGWQAYLAGAQGGTGPGQRPWAETWQTSHELEVGAQVTVVISGGWSQAGDGAPQDAAARACGLWVDGDRVGRDDGHSRLPLLAGPWRWRVGAGEYGGQEADPFQGRLTRLRVWGSGGTVSSPH
ncbi:metallophosphoesterase [Actinomyces faecalis]|uniref:metallophosphoesterase n=1 Tax=Actinomyces faecalis TaxID=2722820 RepID=UPI0015571697|nr:metallophosphoesterase [Actinomyces faecalis]